MKNIFLLSLFMLFIGKPGNSQAQPSDSRVRIALVMTAEEQREGSLRNAIQQEVQSLLGANYAIRFKEIETESEEESLQSAFNQVFQDGEIDIVVGMGVLPSIVLERRMDFEKPAIATVVLDQKRQQFPLSADQTSGVSNFTYVSSPFSIRRDLETFQQIANYQRLGIVLPARLLTMADAYFNKLIPTYSLFGAETSDNLSAFVNEINADIDAIYVLPLESVWNDAQIEAFFEEIAKRQLPSFAMPGARYVEKGALAGIAPEMNISYISRRIAVSISRILQGEDPANFRVDLEFQNDFPTFNMRTARKTGVYPSWEWLSRASLFQLDQEEEGRRLNLQSVVFEAMQQNLSIRIAQNETAAGRQDIAVAKSDLRPQLSISTTGVLIDNDRAEASFGSQPNFRWLGSAQASQLIYAEPAYANIAIQKLLQKSREFSLEQTQLDAILEVSEAYLNILQAKSLVRIQNDNVNITRQNLDLAKTKESVGQSGLSDVYRWEAQLPLNKINLNDAMAGLQNARYRLNQLLNRPLEEAFTIEETQLEDELVMLNDERLLSNLADRGRFQAFAQYLETEAMNNLPELGQIKMAIAANDRLLLSQERAFYTPSVFLSSQADYNLASYSSADPRDIPDLGGFFPETNKVGWNVAVGMQLPIFQGGRRKAEIEKTAVQSLQLQNQETDLRNQLRLRLRASLENARTSYAEIKLAQDAQSAAGQNLIVAQNAYGQGMISVAQLIDAQNAALQTRELAANAVYQFLIDFLRVERSLGDYYFLKSKAEQEAFLQRFIQFLIKE